ncbi:unnamed protein product [Alternaria sp. RS040]
MEPSKGRERAVEDAIESVRQVWSLQAETVSLKEKKKELLSRLGDVKNPDEGPNSLQQLQDYDYRMRTAIVSFDVAWQKVKSDMHRKPRSVTDRSDPVLNMVEAACTATLAQIQIWEIPRKHKVSECRTRRLQPLARQKHPQLLRGLLAKRFQGHTRAAILVQSRNMGFPRENKAAESRLREKQSMQLLAWKLCPVPLSTLLVAWFRRQAQATTLVPNLE